MHIVRLSVAAIACAFFAFAAPSAQAQSGQPASAQIVQNGQTATLLAITAQTRMAARAMGFGGVGHYLSRADLVEMILEGRQPPGLTLTALISQSLPHSWAEQRAHFAALR